MVVLGRRTGRRRVHGEARGDGRLRERAAASAELNDEGLTQATIDSDVRARRSPPAAPPAAPAAAPRRRRRGKRSPRGRRRAMRLVRRILAEKRRLDLSAHRRVARQRGAASSPWSTRCRSRSPRRARRAGGRERAQGGAGASTTRRRRRSAARSADEELKKFYERGPAARHERGAPHDSTRGSTSWRRRRTSSSRNRASNESQERKSQLGKLTATWCCTGDYATSASSSTSSRRARVPDHRERGAARRGPSATVA